MSIMFILITGVLVYFIVSENSLDPKYIILLLIIGLWEIWDKLDDIHNTLKEK